MCILANKEKFGKLKNLSLLLSEELCQASPADHQKWNSSTRPQVKQMKLSFYCYVLLS